MRHRVQEEDNFIFEQEPGDEDEDMSDEDWNDEYWEEESSVNPD